MALIVDNRAAVGTGPGVHALIVGVSRYPFLAGGETPVANPWGMGQLTSTASSADLIVEWLREASFPVPLATCRVLLSPAANEALTNRADAATVDSFRREARSWRADAQTHRQNVTFFYFAGHGVQRTKEDAVLCLERFRDETKPVLSEAVDLASIVGGMSPAPGREDIARTQFYFIDACRVRPEDFARFEPLTTSAVFDKELAGEDDRCSPIFFSSVSNHAAFAVPRGQTLFSHALLTCLRGAGGDSIDVNGAGDATWGVSVDRLNESIRMIIDDLNRLHGADQTFVVGGQIENRIVCMLDGPPLVDIELELVPSTACVPGTLRVIGLEAGDVVLSRLPPIDPHPFRGRIRAGLYSVELTFRPPHAPFVDRTKPRAAQSPRTRWKLPVT